MQNDICREAKGISHVVSGAWYEAKMITPESCIVYGEFRAQETQTQGKSVIIDMDTRITASIHREPDISMLIGSLHQSIPYIYQREGEYYPKTFAEQAEDAFRRSAIVEQNIQLDPMTGRRGIWQQKS